MLLPILIPHPNVNKNLDKPDIFVHLQSLIGQTWKIIETMMAQFSYLIVTATTPAKISYSPRWIQQNAYQQSPGKYYYVLACYQQKNQQFFQQMSQAERQELLEKIKYDYQDILINYFTTDKTIKEKIDKFINAVFYANIPVPQIIEVHMEVIEEFSKQLKLEGRSDETLLDYRLTLIDILAHLCEVYRSSISKLS